ncbi:MAG: YggT family protein [Candidatus Moraniibacteriota bacterium]|nr:MAG: YggT family protein [Candidatus Moranbacteria bacterium]
MSQFLITFKVFSCSEIDDYFKKKYKTFSFVSKVDIDFIMHSKFMLGIIRTLVNIVFGIIEFLLMFRFVFIFFAANSSTPFVVWVYGVTESLVSPFVRILPDFNLGGFLVDFATLVALVLYAFFGYLLLQLFSYIDPRDRRDL